MRHSITVLCWLYHIGQDGPIFNYRTSGKKWGVHLWINKGKFFVRYTTRDYSEITNGLSHTTERAGGWKFVGASYDHASGEAKLWEDGSVVQSRKIGAGHELATQDSIRMGVKGGEGRHFKGRITQMQVYSVALTQVQIQTIQKRTQRTGNTASYILIQSKRYKMIKIRHFVSKYILYCAHKIFKLLKWQHLKKTKSSYSLYRMDNKKKLWACEKSGI